MRRELSDFIARVASERPEGVREDISDELNPSESFFFSALRHELCLGGVYIRYEGSTKCYLKASYCRWMQNIHQERHHR